MATGTAPVMPTSGAEAATTKNTIPATPSMPFLRLLSLWRSCSINGDLLIELKIIHYRTISLRMAKKTSQGQEFCIVKDLFA
jgi:hypothetical protein